MARRVNQDVVGLDVSVDSVSTGEKAAGGK